MMADDDLPIPHAWCNGRFWWHCGVQVRRKGRAYTKP